MAIGRKPKSLKQRVRPLMDGVAAILLISPNARRLCGFYRATLGLPLKEERHDEMPLHYGCELGDVHIAIHDAKGWPGVKTKNARSPVIAFNTSNLKAAKTRLSQRRIKVKGPTDHGFGYVISFRDPDGNHVMVIEYAKEHW